MSRILIVGNVLKDVYLQLDDANDSFEPDEHGINWLELGFNGDSHNFFQRTSVFGGAAVSLSVLHNLGLDAAILNSNNEMSAEEITWSNDPADYRYIFSYKGGITYFVPSARKATDWAMPKGTPDWLLVDRSTSLSERLVDEIANFLKFSGNTKLAVHLPKTDSPEARRLATMADILFLEDEPPIHHEEKIVDQIELDRPNTQLVCHISPRKIIFGDAEESWSLDRADMMTHLTVYSTIVATILGVIVAGGSPHEALLWARINAEQATLKNTLKADRLRELAKAELDKRNNLRLIARSLMTTGKGILALDESPKSLGRRLEKFEIANNSQNRHTLHRIMLTTPALRESVNGVILSPENSQEEINNQTFLEYVTDAGIIPGIKIDYGLTKIKFSEETHTLGAEGLAGRLRQAYAEGFRFAKWRAAFLIAADQPGFIAIEQNADELANFAKEAQLAGLVPVVEVDFLADGDHTIEKSAEVTTRVLETVFERLAWRHVDLPGCLLKCSMVSNGKEVTDESNIATPNEIGMATAAILRHAVPRYLAGILLLSGGVEAKVATKNLAAVMQNSPFPWPMTFAFSRAFEEPVLATWKGDPEKVRAAQATFARHLAANCDVLHYARIESSSGPANTQKIDVLDWS